MINSTQLNDATLSEKRANKMVQFTKQKSYKNKIYQTEDREQSVRLQNTFHTKKKTEKRE